MASAGCRTVFHNAATCVRVVRECPTLSVPNLLSGRYVPPRPRLVTGEAVLADYDSGCEGSGSRSRGVIALSGGDDLVSDGLPIRLGKEIDEHSAQATLRHASMTVAATLRFNKKGQVNQITAKRYREDGWKVYPATMVWPGRGLSRNWRNANSSEGGGLVAFGIRGFHLLPGSGHTDRIQHLMNDACRSAN